MTIGELLHLCRDLKGLTLRQVEAGCGVSNAYLSQVETGKVKEPSFGVMVKLADFYGLTLERFAALVR